MLVKYPSISDSDIARATGLNQSTVSTINKRLRGRGAYRQLRIPRLQSIGCELISCAFFDFSLLADTEHKRKYIADVVRSSNGLFFWLLGKNQGLLMWMNRNYSEAIIEIERVENLLIGEHIVEKPFKKLFLPFEITRINRFFDFSEIVRRNFELEPKKFDRFVASPSLTDVNINIPFSPMEKKVFYGLIRYPEMLDKDLGAQLGVSRHTISKMKHNFYENGLIRDLKLPSFTDLGIEIISFVYAKFKIGDTIDSRADTTRNFLENYPVITSIATNREAATMLALTDFSQYQEVKHYALGGYMKSGHVVEEPEILLFSTKETLNGETFHLDFTKVTSRVLGIS